MSELSDGLRLLIFVLCNLALLWSLTVIYRWLKQGKAIRKAAWEAAQKKRGREEAQHRTTIAEQGQQLINKHADLVLKFLEIAERKVSQLDEYGDEQRSRLYAELETCLTKIAERERSDEKICLRSSTATRLFTMSRSSGFAHAFRSCSTNITNSRKAKPEL
jgi:hypothetical protein